MDLTTTECNKQTTSKVRFTDTNKVKSKRLVIQTALSKRIRQQLQLQKNQEPLDEQKSQSIQIHSFLNESDTFQPPKPTKSILKRPTNSNQQIQIFKERAICSSRAVVATFIIVVLLFIGAGISVGVVFATIKSDKSSSSDSNNHEFSMAASVTQLPMSTIITGDQSGSPCSSSTYTSINDPSRSYNFTNSHRTCDNGYPFITSNGGAWIRFEGSGGTNIPTWPIDINHCGGYLSIWSNTSLPTVMNASTNITLCYSNYLNSCHLIQEAPVVYCPGGYYVYFLRPVYFCNTRYCTA